MFYVNQKTWAISVNMGYGHQRTANPLKYLAFKEEIINANDYNGIPINDKKIWEIAKNFYESISRFSKIPLIGKSIFSIYDQFQKIFVFYPKRDLSKPTIALKLIHSLIKKGWGKHLIKKLKEKSLPIITTFFIPAFMAEFFDYPGEIFCVICDADINRTWVPLNPQKSKIKYLVPNQRTAERLKLYNVKPENIFLTGYPLPLENISSQKIEISKMEILKEDLKYRLLNLDPKNKYFEKYQKLIEKNLGKLPKKSNHPLTIMFSVGGAGAQKQIGIKIIKNLALQIKQGKIKIILAVGIKEKIKKYFEKNIENLNLSKNNEQFFTNQEVEILFENNIEDYFQKFNLALRKTDILWTKPSELSFYSALGIPIIIAPSIGCHEEFNKRWVLKSGFGIFQENPNYITEWLFDWLNQGYLAEAAMQGFIKGEKLGTFNIEQIISKDRVNL
ncbi:MAG: hypothetical protein ABH808_00920 [Candidatus Kuenenbacteria bacterium]